MSSEDTKAEAQVEDEANALADEELGKALDAVKTTHAIRRNRIKANFAASKQAEADARIEHTPRTPKSDAERIRDERAAKQKAALADAEEIVQAAAGGEAKRAAAKQLQATKRRIATEQKADADALAASTPAKAPMPKPEPMKGGHVTDLHALNLKAREAGRLLQDQARAAAAAAGEAAYAAIKRVGVPSSAATTGKKQAKKALRQMRVKEANG